MFLLHCVVNFLPAAHHYFVNIERRSVFLFFADKIKDWHTKIWAPPRGKTWHQDQGKLELSIALKTIQYRIKFVSYEGIPLVSCMAVCLANILPKVLPTRI